MAGLPPLLRPQPIWVFAALSACMAAGYGVVFTIVGDYRDAYGITETEIGFVIGAGFLSAFVAQVLLAPVADRGRARQMVIFGVVVNVVGLLMMAFGTALAPILFGRIVSGVGIGAAGPAIRRIVVLSDQENLGRNLGAMVSADVFGFAMGPAISAVLVGPFGLASPFLVVCAATVFLVVGALGVKVHETDEAVATRQKRLALDLLNDRVVAGAVVLAGAAFLMIGAFDALWDVVHEDLGTRPWMANLGITLFALPLIVLGPIGGKLAQRIGPFFLAGGGLAGGAAFLTAYGFLPTGSWIFGVAMFHAIVDGATIAASGIAVSMSVPEHRQAGAQGVIGAAQALSGGLAAIVIGATYEGFGRAAAYSTAAVGMLILLVAGMLLAKPGWRRRADDPTATARVPLGAGS